MIFIVSSFFYIYVKRKYQKLCEGLFCFITKSPLMRMPHFPSKADRDGDGVGNVCVGDTDGDSVVDYQVLNL